MLFEGGGGGGGVQPRIAPVVMPPRIPAPSLRAQHPNLMLRCMRAIRLLHIEMTPMRHMYVRMFVVLKVLERRNSREDVQALINSLTTDAELCRTMHVDLSDRIKIDMHRTIEAIQGYINIASAQLDPFNN